MKGEYNLQKRLSRQRRFITIEPLADLEEKYTLQTKADEQRMLPACISERILTNEKPKTAGPNIVVSGLSLGKSRASDKIKPKVASSTKGERRNYKLFPLPRPTIRTTQFNGCNNKGGLLITRCTVKNNNGANIKRFPEYNRQQMNTNKVA